LGKLLGNSITNCLEDLDHQKKMSQQRQSSSSFPNPSSSNNYLQVDNNDHDDGEEHKKEEKEGEIDPLQPSSSLEELLILMRSNLTNEYLEGLLNEINVFVRSDLEEVGDFMKGNRKFKVFSS